MVRGQEDEREISKVESPKRKNLTHPRVHDPTILESILGEDRDSFKTTRTVRNQNCSENDRGHRVLVWFCT
jgi:hypothetical protein